MEVKKTLKKAVSCDKDGFLLLALHYYQEGVNVLTNMLGSGDFTEEHNLQQRIRDYKGRAEEIRVGVMKRAECGTQIFSETYSENSTGHGYKQLFEQFLDPNSHEILIMEPSFGSRHELQNLVHWLEVVVAQCPDLKCVRVQTNLTSNQSNLDQHINDIEEDLNDRGIALKIAFDQPVQESKVVLDDGRIIQIHPSLHYFKPITRGFSLGLYEYNLRKCEETTISVYAPK